MQQYTKAQLWFQFNMAFGCADFEVVYTLSCHQKIAVELKIANQRRVTKHFKVTISNYQCIFRSLTVH